MTGNVQEFALAPAVESKLAALRRRIRRYVWVHGLAAAVAWLGVAFWISLGVDWLFEPAVIVRAVFLGAVGVVLAGVLCRLILRRAFVRLSNRNMAMLLERSFPQFDESLLTAVELSARADGLGPYTRRMLDRTSRRAAEPIESVRFSRVFNPVPLRRAVLIALLLAAGILSFGVLAPEAFALWTRRCLRFGDELWPRNTRLVVEGFADGVVKVARGDDLTVIAKADLNMPEVPDVVRIRYRVDGGSRLRRTMTRLGTADPSRDRFQEYSHTFTSVLAPIRFDVVGGDDVVRDLRIEVVPSATVVDMALDCRYPEYMDRPPQTIPVTGSVQIPKGTRVTIRATANKDLVRAQISDGEESHVRVHEAVEAVGRIVEYQDRIRRRTAAGDDCRQLAQYQRSLADYVEQFTRYIEAREDARAAETSRPSVGLAAALGQMLQVVDTLERGGHGEAEKQQEEVVGRLEEARRRLEMLFRFRSFSHTIPKLTEDTTLLFVLFDADGLKSRRPLPLAISAQADEPPKLAVHLRGIGPAITSQARLPAAGEVSDDFGVARIWFEWVVDQKQGGNVPIREPSGNVTQLDLDAAMEVRPLSLSPGQKLLVRLKAADRCDLAEGPNETASERWLLDVVTPGQLRILLEARELALRQRFQRVIQEVTETRDLLARMRFDRPVGDDASGPAAGTAAGTAEDVDGEQADAPDGKEPPPAEQTLASRMLRVQRALQNSQKNAHETLGLAEAFADVRLELINNRIDTAEWKIRLEAGIAEPLRRIADEMFPELDRRLNRLEAGLIGDSGPQQRSLAVEQTDAILATMRSVLRRMLELEDFNKAVELLRRIIRAQKDLGDQVKQRHKDKLRELLEN
ncbi:MAG: coiled-coil domain-containing protein [Planctomycetota bacterium]|jgi:hypothetical protein